MILEQEKPTFGQWLKSFFSEENLIDLVARASPWMAPLIPAIFAYQNAVKHLGMPERSYLEIEFSFQAFVVAAVVEFLGLATIHTTLSLYQLIRESKPEKAPPKWMLGLMAGMSSFYLLTIIIVNIILDFQTGEMTVAIAKAVLSLISIPAAITLSIRHIMKRSNIVTNWESKLTKLRVKLMQNGKVIKRLKEQIENVTRENATLKKQLSDTSKDDTIKTLQDELAQLQRQIDNQPVTRKTAVKPPKVGKVTWRRNEIREAIGDNYPTAEKVKKLAARFNASPRTIYRDLEEMGYKPERLNGVIS